MLIAKQVVDSLYWVEGRERNFHKDGVPVAHRSVPQSRQFKSLELLAVLAFRADEACVVVDMLEEVEAIALIVLCSANEVNGIEVGAVLEHGYILGIISIYLARLQNLKAHGSVSIIAYERTATRLAHILYDSAYAHRTVELFLKIDYEFGILQILDVMLAAVEVLLYEANHLLYLGVGVRTRLKYAQIFECLLLGVNEDTSQHLLIQYGIGLDTVGHYVVDVLDEHYVGIDVVEVLDESTMTAWTEQQSAVFVAERSVVGIGCDGVGTGLLLREAYIETDGYRVSQTTQVSQPLCP